jgi:RHH-type proline utilization regulon transcriptional repressor/proline dehydrogenase/delta 1-pyrroline-5-carboxylate dehydrogenase
MGEALYNDVVGPENLGRACRIYAPVGDHEDLLAYLVRRLLENGANTSFVNRIADDELPVAEIIRDPVERSERYAQKSNPLIPRPLDIYGKSRRNSLGLPLWEKVVREPLVAEMQAVLQNQQHAGPIIGGKLRVDPAAGAVVMPQDRRRAIGSCTETDEQEIERAFVLARSAQPAWDRLGGEARARILERAADLYEENRTRLMATMIGEGGKTIANALGDVREAVDFLRFYAGEARRLFAEPVELKGATGERNLLSLHGRGVFTCISPWNFPLAIYTGQIAGALAAGNAVLAKPAEQTPITAFIAAELMHRAGVPNDVLQFLPGGGGKVGARLVADKRTDGIAFTGSNETAWLIQQGLTKRGGAIVPFIAETGGINAMIVDSSALPEQVVRDAVTSAFDSAGQRCSALRVLFLQDDVAAKMLEMLLGAIRELKIGDPMDYATDVGPVIDEAAEDMLNAHKTRMRREAKELIDLPIPAECRFGTFVSPAAYEISGIDRLEREVFGPILHVVRYSRDKLDKVCEAINATGYGLTLGLHSRIAATADFVAERVRVGNLYINRNQIGAVVNVQPFGGEGLSGTGPKAGGPHYVARFATERVRTTDITATGGNTALLSLEPTGEGDNG